MAFQHFVERSEARELVQSLDNGLPVQDRICCQPGRRGEDPPVHRPQHPLPFLDGHGKILVFSQVKLVVVEKLR